MLQLLLAILLSSPNGKLVVNVSDADGVPNYTVAYDGEEMLAQSPLGLVMDTGDFANGMTITAVSPTETIAETYCVPTIKQREVSYTATRSVLTFSKDGQAIYDIIFQISDRDVAFKYALYEQRSTAVGDGKTRCAVITDERSSFTFPDGTTTFLTEQCEPMGQWARTAPSYEKPYTCDGVLGYNGSYDAGFTFPCLFRVGAKGWVLISETGVDGSYCGGRLVADSSNTYKIAFPQATEFNGNGTTCPGVPLPGETPWRTITVGADLAPIVETTVAFDVVKPLYAPSKDYQYGAGTWSWIIEDDQSVNFDDQVRYIDLAAAMGWQTVLVDNFWDVKIGRERMAELADYARSKGIELYLWYHTNGYWTAAPQTPRNIMNRAYTRHSEMKWLREIGVRGIKVDFMGSDKQVAMQLFEDIMADANEYGLLVIFHGCTIPRGWERMFPNYVASEAVLASENLRFEQAACDAEAYNATIHPFIRNSLGAMDFGGSGLNAYYNRLNSAEMWGGKRQTSDVFALATAVLFQSPVQHFALAPNNLTDAPDWALAFMSAVPTTWDEVQYLAGYPGRSVVLARRSGSKWYIAGVNNGEPFTKDFVKHCAPKGVVVPKSAQRLTASDAFVIWWEE